MERIALSSENNLKFDKDYPYGYPWPPRYYTCSFCQREFKSAQALGGHMNIHRRDRARLRDLSPPPTNNNNNNNNNDPLCPNNNNENPSFNSNPNNPSSHPSSLANGNIYAHQCSLVSLSLSSIPPPLMKNNGEKLGPTILESREGFGRDYERRVGKWKYVSSSFDYHQHHEHEVRVLNNNNNNNGSSTKEIMRLDLELCLGEAKEDLDLELRLGF